MEPLKYYSAVELRSDENEPQIVTEDPAFREYLDRRQRERDLARKLAKATAAPKQRVKRSKSLRRAKTTPEIVWLKELICPFVYGEKSPDGVRPSVNKEVFVGRWNMRMGLPSLPNYKLVDHFHSAETLYFFGNGWEKCKRTLVMIDIDVLKSKGLGSPEGAKRFTEHLKQFWPNLYFETSTNGKGIHGYFLLSKCEIGAERANAALKRFEKWLRAESQRINADIEQVEIKGACLDMALEGKSVQSVKYGSFAKLPRDISRFDEWQNTTVLRVRDLESRLFDEVAVPKSQPEVRASVHIEKVLETVVQMPIPMLKPSISTNVFGSRPASNSRSGSITDKVINEQQLACIPVFERLYREWVGSDDLIAGKFRVTAHDFAVAMVILKHFKTDPNSDGSMPTRRVGEMWAGLYKAGDVQRGWNHHRWKVIRDFLSAKGHIDWNDHRYEYGTVVLDETGNKDEKKSQRGIACKWAIAADFDDHLSFIVAFNTGEASFVDTKKCNLVPHQGKGQNLKPQSFLLRVEMEQKFWLEAYCACETYCAA